MLHEVLLSDAAKYVELISQDIDKEPNEHAHYFARHEGWRRLHRDDLALADLNRSIELRPMTISYLRRGALLGLLGFHREALCDYERAEALEPDQWPSYWGPLHQAVSLAELGEEDAAVSCCAKLSDSHWTPGFDDLPGGNKAEVTDQIRRRAREVAGRLRNGGPSSRTE